MKKIFLDCGTHLAEGLMKFIQMYNMDSSWEIYSFEPNTYLWQEHNEQNVHNNIHYINKAIYTNNEIITFNIAYPNTDSSSIYKNHIGKNYYGSIDVMCLDFSEFIIQNFSKDDFIVVKMDIEGAEYAVLRKMIEDNSIQYLNDLFVEFHSHKDMYPILENGEDKNSTIELIKEIEKIGVKFTHWV